MVLCTDTAVEPVRRCFLCDTIVFLLGLARHHKIAREYRNLRAPVLIRRCNHSILLRSIVKSAGSGGEWHHGAPNALYLAMLQGLATDVETLISSVGDRNWRVV